MIVFNIFNRPNRKKLQCAEPDLKKPSYFPNTNTNYVLICTGKLNKTGTSEEYLIVASCIYIPIPECKSHLKADCTLDLQTM